MIVKQGNREFLEVTYASGQKLWFVFRVNGEHYFGKSYGYHKCKKCGQLICDMMGGAKRHHKMCDKREVDEKQV